MVEVNCTRQNTAPLLVTGEPLLHIISTQGDYYKRWGSKLFVARGKHHGVALPRKPACSVAKTLT